MQKMNLLLAIAATHLMVGNAIAMAKPAQAPTPEIPLRNGLPRRATGADINTIHYLTMTLPETATKRFARLSFSFTDPQRSGSVAPIRFNLPETKAFVGTPGAIARMITIQSTWIDETGTVWLEFNPSISPKTTLTVVLETQRVPFGSSYEYGIAAYPESPSPVPVFVSNGTLKVR